MIKPAYRSYKNTTVRVEKSQGEITKELAKYGIFMVQHTQTNNVFSCAFQVELEESEKPVTVRIDVPYDREEDEMDNYGWKEQRRMYRVLYFYIKALLTSWDGGLKAFMDIFMPHIVLPGGKTVSQDLLPKYKLAIQEGRISNVPLLPGAEETGGK